jgi:hypothetical protein
MALDSNGSDSGEWSADPDNFPFKLVRETTLYQFTEDEVSPGYWYEGVWNPPTVIYNDPKRVAPVDINADGQLDVITPISKGYRADVDTRSHFQVFVNEGNQLAYHPELTQAAPFVTGARRVDSLYVERFDSTAFVTAAHDTAAEGETRTDIPWRLGDLTITRLDPLEDVTTQIVPPHTLPNADLVNRDSAVNAHAMAVGDINSDGMDDILVADFVEPFALLQTEDGYFTYATDPTWDQINKDWPEPTLSGATDAFPLDLHINDFDGDGHDDILYGRGHGTTLSRILFNDGNGAFSFSQSVALPASTYGADNTLHMKTFSEDFDGDGDIDLIVLNSRDTPYYGGNYLQFLKNNGAGEFSDETASRLIPPDLYPDTFGGRLEWTETWQAVDFDGDGDLDILGARADEFMTPQLFALTNDGDGYFDLQLINNSDRGYPISWGDFDRDGGLEALTFSSSWTDETGQSAINQFHFSELESQLIMDTRDDVGLWGQPLRAADGGEISAEAAQVYRTYYGALDRVPDQAGFDWWLNEIETGRQSLQEMSTGFYRSEELQRTADDNGDGAVSDEEFVFHMYRGVFGREPDQDGYSYWHGELQTGERTEGAILEAMTQSDEYVMQTAPVISEFELL